MAQLNLSLPSFQGLDLSDEKQLRKLTSYLYRLDEQLRYVLNNLGEENLSDSLRTVINTKSDATVINELTGRLQRLSTQIVQTAEAITLKASKEELDALGNELETSVAEFEVTAEAIRSEVSDAASGLQSQIDQQAGEISLRVTGDQLAAGLDSKLDADAPSVGVVAGSTVRITKDEVDITTPKFDVNILGDDGATTALSMTPDGAAFSSLQAPNVMPRYDGPTEILINPDFTADNIAEYPGAHFRNLSDAFSRLSNKVVEQHVTIKFWPGAAVYDTAVLSGAVLLDGLEIRAFATGYAGTVNGWMSVEDCSGYVLVEGIDFNLTNGSRCVYGSGPHVHLDIKGCVFKGTGSGIGIETTKGFRAQIRNCEFYTFEIAHKSNDLAYSVVESCKGDSKLGTSQGMLSLSGAVPSDQTTVNCFAWYGGVVFEDNLSVDQGSGSALPTPVTTVTAAYPAVNHCNYESDGSPFSQPEVLQGWHSSTGRIKGCMWFDNSAIRSALSGKTVLSASLRLSMRKGVGRGASVNVELWGTTASSGASGAALTKNYESIGTFSPGEVATITIPNQAVNDLKNGVINGLVLYSDDTGAYDGRSYSRNYAKFDGSEAADSLKPMLTITYQG